MTAAEVLESRLVQAVVAGTFLAVGWFVNGAQNRRADRRRHEEDLARDRRLRNERLRDVHRAIYAEIASSLANLDSVAALIAYRDDMVVRMERDAGYVPLIPRERNDTIFRAFIEHLYVLPRVTIDPIVTYYNQLFAIEAMIDDMRGERFKTLEPERRIAMYSDYIDMKIQAFQDGQYALTMIGAYAKGGREAALAEEARTARELGINLSSRGGDPSDRSPE